MSSIGQNIKKFREKKQISQDRLSKMADVSLNTIVKLEIDKNPNPTIETIKKITKALEVSIEDII